MKFDSNPIASGPSSSLGIIRFNESEGGPKVGPMVILGIAIAVIAIELVLHLMKFG